MKIKSLWFAGATVVLFVTAAAQAGAMMAAPDETPLLYDRVRAFPAVVVATTTAGFDKNPAAVKGTNCVYLPVKIESVLKGDLKEGPLRLSVHERLPALLAERDGNAVGSKHRYLLVMGLDKGTGYLGAGMVYKDLERFYLTDAGLEKVAKAFIEANDAAPAAMFKMAGALLADKDVSASASACEHVYAVLTRLVAKSDETEWKTLDKASLKPMFDQATAQVREGNAVDSPAAMLVAIAARTDNPAGLTVLDANLAGPARRWLAGEANAPAQDWRPEYMRSASMTPVIGLLGRLKDRAAKDTLVSIAKDSRWGDLRRPVMAALEQILTPEELKGLELPPAPLPPGVRPIGPRPLPRPIIRGGPEPVAPTDN